MSSRNLNCAADLKIAIAHIEAGTGKLGLALLSKYERCAITNKDCSYNGDSCVIPELLEGYTQTESD